MGQVLSKCSCSNVSCPQPILLHNVPVLKWVTHVPSPWGVSLAQHWSPIGHGPSGMSWPWQGLLVGPNSSDVSQPQHAYSMDLCSTVTVFLPLLGSPLGYSLSGMSLPCHRSPTAAVPQGCPYPGVVLPQVGGRTACSGVPLSWHRSFREGSASGFLLIHEVLPSRSASQVVSSTMPFPLASLVSFFHSPNLCRRRLPSLQSTATQMLPFVPSAIGKKEHEIPINYIYLYICA